VAELEVHCQPYLASHVGVVASLLQLVGQSGHVEGKPSSRLSRLHKRIYVRTVTAVVADACHK
jgi:hypothetical protein